MLLLLLTHATHSTRHLLVDLPHQLLSNPLEWLQLLPLLRGILEHNRALCHGQRAALLLVCLCVLLLLGLWLLLWLLRLLLWECLRKLAGVGHRLAGSTCVCEGMRQEACVCISPC